MDKVLKTGKANKSRIRRGGGALVSGIIVRILLIAWGLTVLFPLLWLIMSSFKNNQEFYMNPWALPEVLRFENYVNAWTTANISQYFFNSLLMVVGTLILYMLMLSTTSYILAKYRFPGAKLFENFYFLAMMVPGILLIIPLFFQMQNIQQMLQQIEFFQKLDFQLTDNLFVLMFIYAVQSLPLGIFLLTGFIKNIDGAFIEAAVVDGAGEWCVFSRIVIPFVRPILFFLGLGSIMGTWNEYVIALTFISSEEKYTVPIGLSYLSKTMQYRADFGALFAGLVIAVLPILVLYILFQKQILTGTEASEGIKG